MSSDRVEARVRSESLLKRNKINIQLFRTWVPMNVKFIFATFSKMSTMERYAY